MRKKMSGSDTKTWYMISIKITTGRNNGASDEYIAFCGRKHAFKDAAKWLLGFWRKTRDAEILAAPPRPVSDSLPEFKANREGITFNV